MIDFNHVSYYGQLGAPTTPTVKTIKPSQNTGFSSITIRLLELLLQSQSKLDKPRIFEFSSAVAHDAWHLWPKKALEIRCCFFVKDQPES